MAYKFKRRTSKKHGKYTSYRKSGTKRRATRRGGSTFAKKVMKVVKRAAEHKQIAYNAQVNIATPAGGVFYQLDLSPNNSNLTIPQGTGQGNRVGNKVRVVKATLKYILQPYPYDAILNSVPQPQDVRMIISSTKGQTQNAPPLASFMQYGNTSQTAAGYSVDMLTPVNRDTQTVYKDWRHKVGASAVPTVAGTNATYFSYNNDYKLNVMKTVDLTKFYPKNIDYNDTTVLPTDRGVFLNVLTDDWDGTTSASTYSLKMTYMINVIYEDL